MSTSHAEIIPFQPRARLLIAKKRLIQSDSDFRLQTTSTITQVQRSYWDLVLALREQQNRVANVNLAKENLRQIEAKIDAGAAAPLQRAEVDTELANREGDLLSSTQQVSVAETALKQLVIKDPLSSEWSMSIVPTDDPKVGLAPASVEDALKDAMDNRFELKRLRLQKEINDLDIRFYRNQIKPQIDLNVPAGSIGITSGPASASSNAVDITVYGRGGHGSQPHRTIDPIVLGARIVTTLQTIVSREVDPLDSAGLTVGSFHAGTKRNIIPDEAKLSLTVRTYKPETRGRVLAAIARIAKG